MKIHDDTAQQAHGLNRKIVNRLLMSMAASSNACPKTAAGPIPQAYPSGLLTTTEVKNLRCIAGPGNGAYLKNNTHRRPTHREGWHDRHNAD